MPGFLNARGIAAAEARKPYFRPTNKPAHLLLREVRVPAEPERLLPDGKTVVRVHLIADITHEGVEKVWELSSLRAVAAINSLPEETKLPVSLKVWTVGKGKELNTLVELGAAEAPRLPYVSSDPCPAPSCPQPAGHVGRHGTVDA